MEEDKMHIVQDQRAFLMLYIDCMNSELLETPYQKLVYFYLKKFANDKNQCFPSITTLIKQTKINKRTLLKTLNELEEKGVLKKENRRKEDGGKTSNLYTLYDTAEIWKANDRNEVKDAINQFNTNWMIKQLNSMGYTVEKRKEKEPELKRADLTQTHADYDGSNSFNNSINHDTEKERKSQEPKEKLRYTLDEIKEQFDYETCLAYAEQSHLDQCDIDSIFVILFDTLNTSKNKKTIRINGDDKPVEVVISKLLTLTYDEILYVLEKYNQQDKRIRNPKSYILTMLYQAVEQMHLDIKNQVNYDNVMYAGKISEKTQAVEEW